MMGSRLQARADVCGCRGTGFINLVKSGGQQAPSLLHRGDYCSSQSADLCVRGCLSPAVVAASCQPHRPHMSLRTLSLPGRKRRCRSPCTVDQPSRTLPAVCGPGSCLTPLPESWNQFLGPPQPLRGEVLEEASREVKPGEIAGGVQSQRRHRGDRWHQGLSTRHQAQGSSSAPRGSPL